MITKEDLRRIYNHLLLNVDYLTDPGLYFGKMGCLLFFAHYAKKYNNKINEDIVSDISEDIYSSIMRPVTYSFERGICGIGWGVEYLLQNELMEGDPDDILNDVDRTILNRDIRKVTPNAYIEVIGIIKYVVTRLTSSSGNTSVIPFPVDYLSELYQTICMLNRNAIFDLHQEEVIISENLTNGRFLGKPISLTPDMFGESVDFSNFPFIPLGLKNGLSGIGINALLKIGHS